LLPAVDVRDLLQTSKAEGAKSRLRTLLYPYLPKALVQVLEQLWWQAIADKPLAEIANAQLDDIAQKLHHWRLYPNGTEGYKTAEVTLGGVSTDYLSSKTMESKTQPGLYFVGECVDVTGHLGGYNFQWAWSSGYAAAQAI